MWQQIDSNKNKSAILAACMFAFLLLVGFAIGEYSGPGGGPFGIITALIVWVIMLLTTYYGGDSIMLSMGGAQKIKKSDNPMLFNVVEEMSIAAGMPKPPDVYVIDDPSPNAFATGRDPKHAAVAVTKGLLEKLNRDELQGVIAHEIAHIVNRDTLFMLYAGIMLGAIVILTDGFSRGLARGSCSRRSSFSSSGKGNPLMLIICIIVIAVAPLVAQLIYFAISRKREYLADACAAQFTRYPMGLAHALKKIEQCALPVDNANKVTAAMYIINPMNFNARELCSTHPSTAERIAILAKMAGADIKEYDKAFSSVMSHSNGKMPNLFAPQMLAAAPVIGLREPLVPSDSPETGKQKIERRRDAEDMMWKLNNYIFIKCDCATTLKIPPEYEGQEIVCPHCKKVHKAVKIAESKVVKVNFGVKNGH